MAKLLPGNSKYQKRCQWGMISKLYSVVRLLLLLFVFFVFYLNPLYGQITSDIDGDWNSSGTWVGGTIPTESDSVIINNTVTIPSGITAEAKGLYINSTLIVDGTLIVYGNLETGNNSQLIANSGSNIFIFGHAILANRVSLDLSSYFVVKGNFTKGGSSNQGDFTISGAHIYIFGEVDVPLDNNGIPWENFSICSTGDYVGTTETENDDCDAGQLDDFVDIVNPEDLPDDIYDQFVDCDSPTANISGDATICEGDLLAYLSFSSSTADSYNIDFDAAAEGQGFFDISEATLSGNTIEISVPENAQPDTYNGELTVTNSTTGCTSEVYNITIIINPLPATSIISTD